MHLPQAICCFLLLVNPSWAAGWYSVEKRNADEVTCSCEDRVDTLEKELRRMDEKLRLHDQLLDQKSKMTHADHVVASRAYVDTSIAFTAYLSADLDGLGEHQPIIFDRTVLNDGNAYNPHSGSFTAPTDGVYAFHFSIAQREVNQLYVSLVVNGHNGVGGVAETTGSTLDDQGGNMATLNLVYGDVVQIVHYGYGSHVEGSEANRLTTFSGFLIYPTGLNVPVG